MLWFGSGRSNLVTIGQLSYSAAQAIGEPVLN